MRNYARLLHLLPALCLAACSGTGAGTAAGDEAAAAASTTAVATKANPADGFRIKSGDVGDDDYDKIASKFGSRNPKMTEKGKQLSDSGKEYSEFKRDNPEFKGRWDNKEYKGGDYKKKSLWGDKDYVTKVYGGNTDGNHFRKDSRFDNRTAGENSKASRDADKVFKTGNYATTSAREGSKRDIPRVSDAETDERRRVFTKPAIMPYSSQTGMTVEDTKHLLGR